MSVEHLTFWSEMTLNDLTDFMVDFSNETGAHIKYLTPQHEMQPKRRVSCFYCDILETAWGIYPAHPKKGSIWIDTSADEHSHPVDADMLVSDLQELEVVLRSKLEILELGI